MKNTPDNTAKELDIPEVKLEHVNMLFLDPSSSCTGYCVAEVNFKTKTAKMINCGAIWFDKYWSNQEKYHYIFRAITVYFNIIGQIDYCFAEAYMLNPKKKQGCQVGPELHGAIQVALAEIEVNYKPISPQTWRSQLGIKATKFADGSKDYKTPTADYLKQYVSLPEKIMSNITNVERKTPNDLTDALAICLGTLTKHGITNFDFSEMKIQEDFTVMMED